MTIASGVGSWPGTDAEEYAEAVRVVLGEVPDLPYLPELPGRGVAAGMVGRTLATISNLGFDLQPAGWRLTDSSGVDHRRARSLLAQDLDQLEEQGQDFRGVLKVQLTGPWTLAATVEKPRGDKVLADHGARRELAQALAEGVAAHLADVRRRVAAEHVVVQVDEPALPAVLSGAVPTASGFGKHRAVHPPEASEALEWVLDEAGTEPWVHSCAAGTPWALLRGAGARGLSGDLSVLGADDLDAFAEALDAGERVALGVVPVTEPETVPSEQGLTERVLRVLDVLGLDPDAVSDLLVVTPACGLAGASPAWARRASDLCRAVGRNLSGTSDAVREQR
ncbi:MAG TPA: methionine synthase [Nocardioides sp.]|uniref:methionine synthase n=1 Tax=Nocardioides sp. TaxID=35761 RepID=UPI002F3F8013